MYYRRNCLVHHLESSSSFLFLPLFCIFRSGTSDSRSPTTWPYWPFSREKKNVITTFWKPVIIISICLLCFGKWSVLYFLHCSSGLWTNGRGKGNTSVPFNLTGELGQRERDFFLPALTSGRPGFHSVFVTWQKTTQEACKARNRTQISHVSLQQCTCKTSLPLACFTVEPFLVLEMWPRSV